MDVGRTRNAAGWFAVGVSLAASCVLAAAGTCEDLFAEWWAPSLIENLGALAIHLVPASVVVVFALLAIRLWYCRSWSTLSLWEIRTTI